MNRRIALSALAGFTACNRKAKGNPFVGRWEGRLSNGLSTVLMQFDFLDKGNNQLQLRATARDLFLSSHVIDKWNIEGNNFQFTLPQVDGDRSFAGYFSGPTFDVEDKARSEKIHMRQLGRVPALPYTEAAPSELRPTNRAVRATARLFGQNALYRHFHADLIARMGIATTLADDPKAGWFFLEDQPLPPPPPNLPFVIILSPSQARIPELAKFPCPIFVLLGEADERFAKLERGTRQLAFDLREALTKQGRKMDSFQISVAPQADRTLRVRGYGKEYPRLGPNYLEHFRRFFARFDANV